MEHMNAAGSALVDCEHCLAGHIIFCCTLHIVQPIVWVTQTFYCTLHFALRVCCYSELT